MQTTFGVIMIAIVNGEPKTLTLKEMLEEYIKFQESVVRRRTLFELKKAEERAHLLEGLKIAVDHIDEIISIIRSSKDRITARTRMTERFGLDDLQTQAIVQMPLGALTGLERQKLEDEIAAIELRIADYKDILSNETRLLGIVKDEAIAVKNKFNDERRTEIATVSGEVDIEDLIPREECVLTLTNFGYVKRQKTDTYRIQRRGGRGVSGMTRREEDVASEMFVINSHDYVMFFTNLGRVYRLKCYEIPEGSRTSKGMNIANLLPIATDEKVTSMIRVPEFDDESYLCMVTHNGIIKRTSLSAYNTARKGGVIAIDLDEGDELSWVRLTDGSSQLLVATRLGMAIRFKETDVRAMGRTARGVKAITLKEGDCVVGMSSVREDGLVLTVSATGYGRLSSVDDYRIQSRSGKGLTNYHVQKYGEVAALKVVDLDDDIIVIASDGIIIRIPANSIRVCARPSKGVRVMRLGEDSKVVTLARTAHEEDAVEDALPIDEGDEDTDEEIETEDEASDTAEIIEDIDADIDTETKDDSTDE